MRLKPRVTSRDISDPNLMNILQYIKLIFSPKKFDSQSLYIFCASSIGLIFVENLVEIERVLFFLKEIWSK